MPSSGEESRRHDPRPARSSSTGPDDGSVGTSTETAVPDASTPPDGDAVPGRRRWAVFAVVLCASIMDRLDATVVNLAAPAIRADLGGGAATVQWIAAGYILAFAVFLVTGGRLGDIYGRRRLFVLGAAGFTAASLACAVATSPGELIAARVVQGAFGALLIPQGFGVIKAMFPAEGLGRAFGLLAPVLGLSTVGGPILAGALIGADVLGTGWRMIFLINLPFGAVAVLGAVRLMPRHQQRRAIRLDLAGVALVTVAALLVVYPLVRGREAGWPPWCFAMLAGGVVVFAVFVGYERVTPRAPIVEPSLLTDRTFVGGLVVSVVFFGVVAGYALVMNLFTQTVLGFSPLRAGLVGVPQALGIAVAAAVAPRLTPRFGRKVLHGGLALATMGMVLLAGTVAYFGASTTAWTLIPATLVIGAGMGLVFGPLFGVVLGGVRGHEVGSASGTLSAVRQFGVAAISTLFFARVDDARDGTTAMIVTGLVVAAATGLTFLLVFVLPRGARPGRPRSDDSGDAR